MRGQRWSAGEPAALRAAPNPVTSRSCKSTTMQEPAHFTSNSNGLLRGGGEEALVRRRRSCHHHGQGVAKTVKNLL
jgi:hypothetical protein